MNLEKVDLTGRTGMRFGLFGRLIIQVEYRVASDYSPGTFYLRWKDASLNEYLRASQTKISVPSSTK